MKNPLSKLVIFVAVIAAMSSCTSLNNSMREPFSRVEFNKNDFTLSNQVSAEATSTKIIGIDWSRLFLKKTGNIQGSSTGLSLASIPVVGSVLVDKTASYALYELMVANTGYDVVFYPQYETKVVKPIGLGFIYKITTVKATARLAKFK
ncbi:MAG: hypothetical protein ABIP51_15305 [Bacteroidia bacterium]